MDTVAEIGNTLQNSSDNFLIINLLANASEVFVNGTTNATDIIGRKGLRAVDIASNVVLTSAVVFVMLGIGCAIEVMQLINHLRRPVGPAIGLFCQFVVLPLSAFGVAHACRLDPFTSLAMVVLAASPGSPLSNVFTYWTDGDVPLSVTMTISSTLLSFGVMPLNIWIYSRSWTSEQLKVPYLRIFTSLVLTVTPAMVGMFLRWKWPKIATNVTKAGSAAGAFVVVISMTLMTLRFHTAYLSPWRVYLSASCFSAVGLTVAYTLTKLLRMNNVYARTVAIETGAQNVPLTHAVISLSFSADVLPKIAALPILCGNFMIAELLIFSFIYNIIKRLNKTRTKKSVTDIENTGKAVEMKLMAETNS